MLLPIENHLRCSFARFKLCAHLLDLRGLLIARVSISNTQSRWLSGRKCRCDENGAFRLRRAAHPNAKLNANCLSELQTMNYAKGHLFPRARVEYSLRALVDRTIREQNREERRLAEQRATKHQFQARNSCVLDGRNYRTARRMLLFARAQF